MELNSVFLTTVDNPYDPFDQFDEWYSYDEAKGYCTCGLLARIAQTSVDQSDEEQQRDLELAMDEIIEMIPDGFYKKVKA